MSTYKRLPRQKLKSTDEFKAWTTHLFEWIFLHWKIVAEVLLAVVILFVIGLGGMRYWDYRQEKAQEFLYEAHQTAEGSVDRVQALTRVIERYGRTPAARLAMFELGSLLQTLGDRDQARAVFTTLSERAGRQPILKVVALHALARIEWDEGKFDSAAALFREAAADPQNLIRFESQYQEALCYERQGKYDLARDLYQKIIAQARQVDARITSQSEERLLWLSANGFIASLSSSS